MAPRAVARPTIPVMMFRIMVLQALYGLSDDQAEFQIQDRLSFMRFLGLGLGDHVPDAKTIWLFREHLTQARAVENLFARFDKHLTRAGYLAMGGQIVDATIVAAPKQRNTDAEKADIKAGKVPDAWKDKPAKLRQKDRDARWTVKFSKAKAAEDGKTQQRDIAIPAFGYKNHAAIDRRHGFIRGWNVTSASAYDGAQLRNRAQPRQHRLDGLGRHRLPLEEERGMAGEERLRLRHPPQEAEGPADERGDVAGQWPTFQDPRLRRARLRAAEIPHGPVRAHHRHRPRQDQDRHGQPRLQSHPLCLAPGANCARMKAKAAEEPRNWDRILIYFAG